MLWFFALISNPGIVFSSLKTKKLLKSQSRTSDYKIPHIETDIYEDQFEKRATAKKERIAKNDVQRMRNIARNRGKKVPGVGETLMPGKDKSKDEVRMLNICESKKIIKSKNKYIKVK